MSEQSSASATTQTIAEPTPAARPRASWPQLILAWAAVLAGLYFARDVLIPIVLGALLALLLRPILRKLRRLKLPDGVSALVLVGSLALVFMLGVWTLAGQAQHWLAQAPQTVERVKRLLVQQSGSLAKLQQTSQAVQDLARPEETATPLRVEVESAELAYGALGATGYLVGASVIVFVLGFFLLAFSETLLRQAVALKTSFAQKRGVVQLLLELENGISRYLLTITVINVCLGIATGMVLWLLRIPNPVLWGVLVTTSNYVPHVGAFICMVVLFFVGAVSHESLGYGLLTAGAFVMLTSAESYFITPLVLSRSLQLSPLAVILAILLGGWLWGIAGGIMAAPLLAVLKIVCDRSPALQVYSSLLAGEPAASGAANGSAVTPAPAASAPSA